LGGAQDALESASDAGAWIDVWVERWANGRYKFDLNF
jgi:hypothetical protein